MLRAGTPRVIGVTRHQVATAGCDKYLSREPVRCLTIAVAGLLLAGAFGLVLKRQVSQIADVRGLVRPVALHR